LLGYSNHWSKTCVKRVVIPELLDTDNGTQAEVRHALNDLRRINRWFGGVATSTALIRKVARRSNAKTLDVLDVATGSGDIPAAVTSKLVTQGIRVHYTIVDRAITHLQGNQRAVAGDALALPFHDASFDAVSCALFVHHLEPEQAIEFVREGLRVARHAVVINDLVRAALHKALIYAGQPLFRSRITRHDSLASVKRSYTVAEMRDFVHRAGARQIEISRHYLYRMGVIAWR
jgi:ubiquinone/menaquinone biosynthesis C-methylase UbiE